MASHMKDSHHEDDQRELSFGMVFELEEIAFQGRRILYEASSRVLNQKKVKLTPNLFCRYCLDRSLGAGLTRLIGALNKKMSVEKLTAEVKKQYIEFLAKASLVPDAMLGAILTEARKQNVAVGALTSLPEDSALPVMSRLKLDKSVKLLVVREGSDSFPTRNCWLDLARMLALEPRRCLALTSCAASCNSALAANMRCVVIPDEFTAFQDFGGADLVVAGAEKLSAKKLFDMLHTRTCSFRQG